MIDENITMNSLPGRGSPGSPGFGLNSQSNGDKNNTSEKIKTSEADTDNVKSNESKMKPPKLPEHKSFELEDLPDDKNPINCHSRTRFNKIHSITK